MASTALIWGFERRPNPFFVTGTSSIQAIMNHSFGDRIKLKKVSKTLTNAEGSRKTEYLLALWMNRFVAFQLHSLEKRTEETPTGVDIERFLVSMVSEVTAIGKKRVFAVLVCA
ncbi:hypothetical protein V499_06833 [Pseudogymnoascus sp. VKM F-103]|nr:hypothetical protein V499_06833 [Pseudogymnoascus sp. VKM F-103]